MFVKVAKLSEIKEGGLKMVDADGEDVCLIKSGGNVYAIQDNCTHEDAPLHEGRLEGNELVCPWHEARFDFATGKVNPETDWAKRDVKIYNVKVEGDDILVDV